MSKLISRLKAFTGQRLDYRPSDREFLKQYGDWEIIDMSIQRNPIESYVKTLLNVITLGKFQYSIEKHFDELFHLFLKITFFCFCSF